MSVAAQPLTSEDTALSPWFAHGIDRDGGGLCRPDRHHFTGLP